MLVLALEEENPPLDYGSTNTRNVIQCIEIVYTTEFSPVTVYKLVEFVKARTFKTRKFYDGNNAAVNRLQFEKDMYQ